MKNMFVVGVFEDPWVSERIITLLGIVMKRRCAQYMVGLIDQPFELRRRNDEDWLPREVG